MKDRDSAASPRLPRELSRRGVPFLGIMVTQVFLHRPSRTLLNRATMTTKAFGLITWRQFAVKLFPRLVFLKKPPTGLLNSCFVTDHHANWTIREV